VSRTSTETSIPSRVTSEGPADAAPLIERVLAPFQRLVLLVAAKLGILVASLIAGVACPPWWKRTSDVALGVSARGLADST
jgi:hypothetical protein